MKNLFKTTVATLVATLCFSCQHVTYPDKIVGIFDAEDTLAHKTWTLQVSDTETGQFGTFIQTSDNIEDELVIQGKFKYSSAQGVGYVVKEYAIFPSYEFALNAVSDSIVRVTSIKGMRVKESILLKKI